MQTSRIGINPIFREAYSVNTPGTKQKPGVLMYVLLLKTGRNLSLNKCYVMLW